MPGTDAAAGPANGVEAGRCFFALWPDPPVRDALFEWSGDIRTESSARRVAAQNLHITLAFLGALDTPRVEAARRVAEAVDWTSAVLVLDRIGYWKRSRIIWAGSRSENEVLAGHAETLRDDLRRVGFRIEARPFVPHVTLFRKARRRPRWASRTISWRIDGFCLTRSHLSSAGARYEIIDRWSATGDVK